MCGRKLAAGSLPAASLPRKSAVLEVLIPGLTGLPSVARKTTSSARVVSSASVPPTT